MKLELVVYYDTVHNSGMFVFPKTVFLNYTGVFKLFFFPPNKRQKLKVSNNDMTPAIGALGPGVCQLIHFCVVIFMGTLFMASTPSLIKWTEHLLIRAHSLRETVGRKRLTEDYITRTN